MPDPLVHTISEPALTLITVVIPAYQASATIVETLHSVCGQTHADLDIIVVDDGSTDATAAIARRHAEADPRIRVIVQPNGGVARARNAGWHAGRADLFCFLDADDLWAPDKLERQLARLRSAPADVGLVYSGYALIDVDSLIVSEQHPIEREGDVLDALLLENFIGNGSAALVTREALTASRGFEPALHDAGAQGCEDLLFYCRVAEHYRFAAAPGALIGYRELPGAMSSNLPRMLRSLQLAMAELQVRYPERTDLIRQGQLRSATWLVRRAILHRKPLAIIALIGLSVRAHPSSGWQLIGRELPHAFADAVRGWRAARLEPRSALPARRFLIGTSRTGSR